MKVCHVVTAARVTNVFLLLLVLLLVLLLTGLRKSDDADVDATSNLIIVANPEKRRPYRSPKCKSHKPVAKRRLRKERLTLSFPMLLDASTLTPKGFTSLRRLCASPVANKLFSRAIMMSLVLASCFGVFHMPSYRRVLLNHNSRDANEVPWRVEKSSVAVVW